MEKNMKTQTLHRQLKSKTDSRDSERAVIGGLLFEPCLDEVLGTGLISSDFSDKNLGLLFDYIKEMTDEDEHVDALHLRNWIDMSGDHSGEWTSFPFLATLLEESLSTNNIGVYANHIRTCRVKNSIEELKFKIEYDNYQATIDQIQSLEGEMSDQSEHSMKSIVGKTIEYIDNVNEHGTGLSSGFESLDALTSGFRAGSLNVLAGRPSMGKSTLALNIANHLSTTKNVLFFSLEMSQVQLMMKMVSCDSNIPLTKVEKGSLNDDEQTNFYESLAKAGNKNMNIIDKSGLSVKNIFSTAKKLNSDKKIDIILIDYLQIMKYDKGREVSELGNITRELKYLAKDLEIPIILLSQLSRGVEQRENKRPFMSDLRSSGEIEQDADMIMFVYRDDYYHDDSPDRGQAELIVAKNRMGQIGFVKCDFDGSYSRFSDIEINLYGKE
jgi:replicative DNA helicase